MRATTGISSPAISMELFSRSDIPYLFSFNQKAPQVPAGFGLTIEVLLLRFDYDSAFSFVLFTLIAHSSVA